MKNNKVNYKTIRGKHYKRAYGHAHKQDRDLGLNIARIIITAIWLTFIGGLCVFFNSAAPLWLLIFWMISL